MATEYRPLKVRLQSALRRPGSAVAAPRTPGDCRRGSHPWPVSSSSVPRSSSCLMAAQGGAAVPERRRAGGGAGARSGVGAERRARAVRSRHPGRRPHPRHSVDQSQASSDAPRRRLPFRCSRPAHRLLCLAAHPDRHDRRAIRAREPASGAVAHRPVEARPRPPVFNPRSASGGSHAPVRARGRRRARPPHGAASP